LAEPPAFLVVALSGRALGVAAHRAGRRAHVLDLFGDTDTRSHAAQSLVVAGSIEHGFDAEALLAAAAQIAPARTPPAFGLVYGSGLEDRPELLARLCSGRELFGNRPETVALTKDPRAFFGILGRLGVPYPAISFTPPADRTDWLVKRVGASGGSHVAPAATAASALPDRYFQRRVPGRPIGVSFLADGRRAVVLGISEQWPWPGGGGSFRFGGALQPAPIDRRVADEIPSLVDAIVAETGLVGLNSLDMLVEGDRFAVIEVNPRPGANLDIFDGIGQASLFAAHLGACRGTLPAAGTDHAGPWQWPSSMPNGPRACRTTCAGTTGSRTDLRLARASRSAHRCAPCWRARRRPSWCGPW